jgi:hypothetical protein
LRGITKLILSKQNKSYSLRNPTHPFIIILRNADQSNNHLNALICQEIKFIYEKSLNEDPVVFLKSFYLHVFLEKFNIKHKIAEFLIEKQGIAENNCELQFLILYLDHLHESEIKNIDFLGVLNKLIVYLHTNCENSFTQEDFLLKIIDILCLIDKSFYIDCTYLWQNLQKTIHASKFNTQNLLNGKILHTLAASLHHTSFINL